MVNAAMSNPSAARIPRIGPGTESAANRAHRVRSQIVRPEDADRIMRLAIDHYVAGGAGEISRVVAARSRFTEEIVDAVIVAAFLEVRGELAVHQHCGRLAVDMARERRLDSQDEFREWMKKRVG